MDLMYHSALSQVDNNISHSLTLQSVVSEEYRAVKAICLFVMVILVPVGKSIENVLLVGKISISPACRPRYSILVLLIDFIDIIAGGYLSTPPTSLGSSC